MKPNIFFYFNEIESVDLLPVVNVGVVHYGYDQVKHEYMRGEDRISIQIGWLSFGVVLMLKIPA